jgi:Protein of unknown function (DUF2878)
MMAMTMTNAVLFNISWLAIVYTQSAMWAPVLAAAHLGIHFSLMGRGFSEARFILGVTLFGVVLDHILFALGVFTISGVSAPAPLWISCIWPVLATTLMHAFSSLQRRVLLASVLGAAGGAASYIGGTGLTEVQFGSAVWGPVTIAILWAVLFPALLAIARVIGSRQEDVQYVES